MRTIQQRFIAENTLSLKKACKSVITVSKKNNII